MRSVSPCRSLLITTALATFASVSGPPVSADPEAPSGARSCLGEKPTIVGTNRADELTGTAGRDVVWGGRGEDRIETLGGKDVVCGGRDDDFVRSGAGDDEIAGGRGDDATNGGAGADVIRTGRGAVEALFGGPGDDRLSGGPGTFDSLVGGPGNDVMNGGDGLDTAEFWDSPAGVQVDLRSDSATGHGDDRVIEIEGVLGSNHDDVLDGDDGSNRLVGQRGNDVIRAYDSGTLADATGDIVAGGAGDDTLDGGDGADVLDYEDARRPVVVDLAVGTAEGGDGADSLAGFEAVIGSLFDDDISGDARGNALAGGEGNDTLDGRGGRDQAAYFTARSPVVVDLEAGTAEGAGSDTLVDIEDLVGSGGDDSLRGDADANVIDGGSGSDGIEGRDGDDTLIGSAGDDAADGGLGTDACDAETESGCETDPARTDRGLLGAPPS